MIFPSRAIIQCHHEGQMPPESSNVLQVCQSRSIPVTLLTSERFLNNSFPMTKSDLIVGDFTWTKHALSTLGIPLPQPPDYPICLQHLLYREMKTTILREVQKELTENPAKQLFIKPSIETKAFSGLIASIDWMEYLLSENPPSLDVHCSELVEFLSEYRVYVIDGHIKSICQYKGCRDEFLDLSVVEEANRLLCSSEEGKDLTGFGMDFGIIQSKDGRKVTALIEVNDGYSLGAYSGVSSEDYTDLLIARWKRLVE